MIRCYLALTLIRRLQQSNWAFQRCRSFAVKELSWCSSSKSPQTKPVHSNQKNTWNRPIERFGIIAAKSGNSIIGVKGAIPWDIPADRKEFVRVTTGKILIVGRKTFTERENLSHISHAAKCIVISNSLDVESIQSKVSLIKTEVMIVHSLSEALDLARRLVELEPGITETNVTTDDIDCWVAGGQTIFHRAVLHSSAWIIHLTNINIYVDVTSYSPSEIARFPPKYHWDHRFTKASSIETFTEDEQPIKLVQQIYKKKTSR